MCPAGGKAIPLQGHIECQAFMQACDEEVLKHMSSASSKSAAFGREGSDAYRELPLSLIKVNERYEFDIYARQMDRYLLFTLKNTPFTEHHASLMKGRGVKLLVAKEDWGKVVEYNTLQLCGILKDPDVSVRDKASMAVSTSMESIRRIMVSPVSRTVGHLEPMAEEMARLILSEDRIMSSLIWVSGHDHFTFQHSVRVGIYATALTLKLYGSRLSRRELQSLSEGYFLHDVGMARVPLSILDKKESLTIEEWLVIRMHPRWGYEAMIKTGQLTPESMEIVLSHHERKDGKGYPRRIKGDDIPLYAKVCALADMFESLTSARPYRDTRDTVSAIKIIHQEMAGEFSLEMLRAFILMLGPVK
jgi:HD-GYP domain-containing protein (c-di-GMP phosphodiesterase class II)